MSEESKIDDLILSIIQTQDIAEQSHLQKCLKDRGHEITPAKLTKLLKKLNINKVAGLFQHIEKDLPQPPLVRNIQISTYGLIVLHTYPGNANKLADFIDKKFVSFSHLEENNNGILGTIAGDDTVLIMTRDKDDLKKIIPLLQRQFPYLIISQ